MKSFNKTQFPDVISVSGESTGCARGRSYRADLCITGMQCLNDRIQPVAVAHPWRKVDTQVAPPLRQQPFSAKVWLSKSFIAQRRDFLKTLDIVLPNAVHHPQFFKSCLCSSGLMSRGQLCSSVDLYLTTCKVEKIRDGRIT